MPQTATCKGGQIHLSSGRHLVNVIGRKGASGFKSLYTCAGLPSHTSQTLMGKESRMVSYCKTNCLHLDLPLDSTPKMGPIHVIWIEKVVQGRGVKPLPVLFPELEWSWRAVLGVSPRLRQQHSRFSCSRLQWPTHATTR